MNFFEPTHMIIIALVVLVLFGPKKIPEFMRNIGNGVGQLKKGLEDSKQQFQAAMDASLETKPAPTVTPVAQAVASGSNLEAAATETPAHETAKLADSSTTPPMH